MKTNFITLYMAILWNTCLFSQQTKVWKCRSMIDGEIWYFKGQVSLQMNLIKDGMADLKTDL